MTRHRPIYPEEREPCGVAGGLSWHYCGYSFDRAQPDLSDCLVTRPKPWSLVIWEPILTLAPSPARCEAFCCYTHTVIFYARPYVKREWMRIYLANGRYRACSPSFEEYDKVETRLIWDDVITFQGEQFEIGGGHVEWARKRWWMVRYARRKQERRAG